ncbi:WUSCHEL-related homeobox 9 [Jatropha curcas]|uniref:WUSCHEL-related homeobox 9 n=1 Tax=Jatropha curcas TaxID=180498 RepID=UPI0005FAA71A|nr:WUSCHEL-related homeobox 9 [Jatropha curcas]XP_020541150.1 WUSCHEL-related homeobox 9 [Jatropha curcas]
MASSNRHWPSMFKSKPCTSHHHQWQHEINSSSLVSSGCHKSPYTSVPGCEERSPEPKPRWNPKPEQIRILEAIFNSGMVNPPRDEIRRIRAQLQEYGQVGDANVFYWFQNRKSRSKHKLRHLQNSKQQTYQNPSVSSSTSALTIPTSSSSSSEKSSPKGSRRTLSLTSPNVVDVSNSPTGSVNQTYFQAHNEFMTEPFFFPAQQTGGTGTGSFTQGFCFSDLSNVAQVQDNTVGPCTSLLLSEMMSSKKDLDHENKNIKMQPNLSYPVTAPITHTIGLSPPFPLNPNSVTVPSTVNQIQGVGESSPAGSSVAARSTVFINDVAIEVGVGPFNLREAFGDDFLLIHSSGQPVLTNEWGLTLHSLQHGASYYLVPLSVTESI